MSLNQQPHIILFTDVSNSIGFGRYAGPYRIASELRENGFRTLVVDFFSKLSPAELRTILQEFIGPETLFVGFSTTLLSLENAKVGENQYRNDYRSILDWQKSQFPFSEEEMADLFSYIKDLNPQTKIVVGGSKAVRGGVKGVDWWLWGEADVSVVALARHLSTGAEIVSSPFHFGSRRVLSDDYTFRNFSESKITWDVSDHVFGGEVLPIEISRGCVFNCSFCTFKHRGKKLSESLKNPDCLYHEMRHNFEHYKTQEYLFSDDTFNDSVQKIKEIIKLKQRLGIDLSFSTFCRLDLITRHPEMVELLLEAGLKCVNFGVESFNEAALKLAHKYTFPQERIKETLFRLKEEWKDQVILTANFIVGLPGESEESIYKTADWLKDPNCPIDSFNFLPLFVVPNMSDVFDKTATLSNKLGDSPDRYDLVVDKWGNWKHKLMDRSRAIQLVNEIEANPSIVKKTTVNRSGFYGRLKNIGFSHDSCVNNSVGSVPSSEFSRRSELLKNTYLTALLNRSSTLPSIKELFHESEKGVMLNESIPI